MSRSGYSDDCDWDDEFANLTQGRYIARRNKAFKGKRGQAFLREMLVTLEAMSDKRLIANDLIKEGAVCAIGAVGVVRGVDMGRLDPEDPYALSEAFGIAPTLVREIVHENDDDFASRENETPEQRYTRTNRLLLESRSCGPRYLPDNRQWLVGIVGRHFTSARRLAWFI